MSLQLRVFRGQAGLEQVGQDWAALVGRMSRRHFFHLREWYESYLAALERNPEDLLFCVVHDAADRSAPAALLPLKRKTRWFAGIRLRTLELPQHVHMLLRDILVSDAAHSTLSLAEIARLLSRSQELRWDVLALWHGLEDSCAMAAYRLRAPAGSICMKRFECSQMALRPWEQLQKTLSKNFKQNLRTANNRAKSIEGLRFETTSSMPGLRAALGMFLDLEASGWKALAGTAIKLDPAVRRFYEELIQRLSPRGGCEVHLLREGEKAIAGLLLFIVDRTVYLPKVAYDEKYARLSPVQLLLENLFKECERRPELEEFNLTSAAGWFDVWKPRQAGVYNAYVFNTTIVGLTAGATLRSAALMGILPRVVRFGEEFLRRR